MTGAFLLWIAYRVGASDEVKEMLWEAWPGVAAAEGTLAEALKGNWGGEAMRRIVASAPEVRCKY